MVVSRRKSTVPQRDRKRERETEQSTALLSRIGWDGCMEERSD